MKIGNDYKIESDTMNVTILKRQVSKNTGEEYWQPLYYYATPESALEGLINYKIMGTGFEDYKDVISQIRELKGLVKSLNIPEKLHKRQQTASKKKDNKVYVA